MFGTKVVLTNIFFRSLVDFEITTHNGPCAFISKLVYAYWTINNDLDITMLPRDVRKKVLILFHLNQILELCVPRMLRTYEVCWLYAVNIEIRSCIFYLML
jgi:hypothetical protein